MILLIPLAVPLGELNYGRWSSRFVSAMIAGCSIKRVINAGQVGSLLLVCLPAKLDSDTGWLELWCLIDAAGRHRCFFAAWFSFRFAGLHLGQVRLWIKVANALDLI